MSSKNLSYVKNDVSDSESAHEVLHSVTKQAYNWNNPHVKKDCLKVPSVKYGKTNTQRKCLYPAVATTKALKWPV